MSNPLDLLKDLDKSKIQSQVILKNIETALTFYDEREDLSESEKETYQKLYRRATAHIQDIEEAELKKAEDEARRIEVQQRRALELEEKRKKEEQEKIKQEELKKQKQMEQEQKMLAEQQKLEAEQNAKKQKEQDLAKRQEKFNAPFPHEKLIMEKGLTANDIAPARDKINMFKANKARFYKTAEDSKYETLLKMSNDIVAKISTPPTPAPAPTPKPIETPQPTPKVEPTPEPKKEEGFLNAFGFNF